MTYAKKRYEDTGKRAFSIKFLLMQPAPCSSCHKVLEEKVKAIGKVINGTVDLKSLRHEEYCTSARKIGETATYIKGTVHYMKRKQDLSYLARALEQN